MREYLSTICICFVMFMSAGCAMATEDITRQNQSQTTEEAPFNGGQVTQNIKVRDIYRACKNYFDHTFNTRENIARKAICNGYFYGIGGTLLTLGLSEVETGVCLPTSFSTEQFIKEFIDWVKSDTDNMNYSASEGILNMLSQNHQCF